MLQIKDLKYQPPGYRQILNGIDLQIDDGRLVVLTGPNGGGKTTLARMIAGVEKPTSGSIIFNGQDITHLDPTQRARAGIGYAFQQPVRFKGFSVRELLSIAKGSPISEQELAETLSLVGLDSSAYADRDVDSHLSGGEIKRIEIASVLVRNASLAVFDEPEAGIDLWSFNSLIRVFEQLRDSRKCSLVIISHQERILSIADEIVMIQDGKLGLHGPRSKMFPLICKNDCAVCDTREGGCDGCIRQAD